ncbi:helix-hairpin-helix domain-containing protein [Emticicia sp. TH156]|uniref:helix-hairpin-helix domain-containing protein n=1 Tax=Emticicia sp. TH156 TaxID=2067454 RepID=UPI000C787FE9|nr:helix-hairpin-helix domain-containing protein [Emticicia sp. TH156]PLK45415.1 transporter [Emticicia sp. TH156]
MNRILKFIRASLSMSSHEAKGVLVAFFIIIAAMLFMAGADYFFSQKPQNLTISSPKDIDSLTVALDTKASAYSKYGEGKSGFGGSEDKNYKYFNFNPNTATVAQFQELGLPKFIAERIEKYRSKGGKFRKKEDFKKIYGLYPETYERLAPYIDLPSADETSVISPQTTSITQPANSEKNEAPAREFKKENKLTRFDLNTADTTQLKLINGIGSGYARRIVKFRDALGGFAKAEQVRETYGLPPETADELLKYGFVSGGIKKLKINQVAVSELRHLYLKYHQAKAIVSYREQHGSFKSIEDLRQIKVLDEATIQKIEPYLEY